MLKPYSITQIHSCQIGISPCPLGSHSLQTQIEKIAQNDRLMLISLLTDSEVRALQLQEESSLCESWGIAFRSFPIIDTSIPGAYRFMDFIEELYGWTEKMDRMLIHCRAGIGRSGLIGLGLMMRHGLPLRQSIISVSNIRGFDVPQSASQRKLLSFYVQELEKKGRK